jgi:DNA polymerase iota
VRGNLSLAQSPVGIVQKHLVVTCNYVARALGVSAMSSVKDALACCPQLKLIDGSDLTPFRRAAAEVRATVREHLQPGTPLQWLGLDEIFVDATAEVAARAAASTRAPALRGHVRGEMCDCRDIDALSRGSELAEEIRALVRRESGYTMRAGIGESKLASKLAAGLQKPDDQTTFLSREAVAAHLATLPPTAIPGFGRGYWARLRENYPEVETVAHLLDSFPPGSERLLTKALGCTESIADWVLKACAGVENIPVVPSGPPKLVSNEDAMGGCSSRSVLIAKLKVLARHVLSRLADASDEHGPRSPNTLVIKYRFAGTGYKPTQRAVAMPVSVCSPNLRNGHARFEEAMILAVGDVVRRCVDVLGKELREPPYSISLLGLGATNFSAASSSRASVLSREKLAGSCDSKGSILNFMRPKSEPQSGPPATKGGTERPKAAIGEGRNEVLTCPICNKAFPSVTNFDMLNRHVDNCMASISDGSAARKKNRLSSGGGTRIDQFFAKKGRFHLTSALHQP